MFISVRIFLATVITWLSNLFGSRMESVDGNLEDFELKSISGKSIKFADYKHRKLLLINTASRCGLTGQLSEMQKLHERFGDKITIIGFPSNDFLWQEPGTNREIAQFCEMNYGVNFLMTEKISVKGAKAHPLFKWLKQKTGKSPVWNFTKYFVDEKRNVVFYSPKTSPLDRQITDRISLE